MNNLEDKGEILLCKRETATVLNTWICFDDLTSAHMSRHRDTNMRNIAIRNSLIKLLSKIILDKFCSIKIELTINHTNSLIQNYKQITKY